MGLFSKPEVVVLKDTCDSKDYLEKLKELRTQVPDTSKAAERIDREIIITKAGINGEDSIMFELKNSGMDLVVIRDLYIETKDGRGAQIDFFVITPYANVFIECKNLFGNIEINSKGDFIRTIEYGKRKHKEGIYSPITQNERHLAIYKEMKLNGMNPMLKLLFEKNFSNFHKGIVVLANPKTVINDRWAKKEIKDQVIRVDQLINYLKGIKCDIKSSKKEMREIGETLLSVNIEERTDYLKKFEDLVEETKAEMGTTVELKSDSGSESNPESKSNIESEPNVEKPGEEQADVAVNEIAEQQKASEEKGANEATEICPRCGGSLVLRTAKKGQNVGNRFYGCSNFPKCRYIKNL